jgi:hypothetical protein
MKMPNINRRGLVPALKGCLVGFAIVLIVLEAGGRAQTQELPASANDLVRKVVANELKPESGNVHYTYRLVRMREDGGSITRQLIETKEGVFGRIIAINGKPLTPAQRDREDKRLQRLLSDPSALASKRKEQREDEARVRRMVGALPEAFLYEYAGTEAGANGGQVTLKFTPNPKYDPPTRELQVYTGMQGTLVINRSAERIAKIDGTLFRDVSFGWGILGKLYKGGRFVVEQSDVGGGDWEPTKMVLNLTGKLLLVKSVSYKSTEISSNFRRVPNDLTVAQALDMLKKADNAIAENGQ